MGQIQRAQRIYREGGLRGLAGAILHKAGMGRISPGPVAETPYLDWLTFANAGMLDKGNIDSMDYAIRNLPSAAPMIEIGSFCGLSTNVLTYLKEKRAARNRLITCDRWLFEGAANGEPLGDSTTVTHEEYRRFVKESFLRNVRLFSRYNLPFTVELFSDEFFESWARQEKRPDVFGREIELGGPISFCYIDGNHSYEFARRDFENCDQYLECGGFVLFDDSADDWAFEVRRVIDEVKHTGRYDLIARNPNYLFQKISSPSTPERFPTATLDQKAA